MDGYEQLNLYSRAGLLLRCRRRGWGLLVTSHRDVYLPTLLRTQVELPLVNSLVDELLSSASSNALAAISAADIELAFSRRGSDVRELLFDLYDLYEERSGGGSR